MLQERHYLRTQGMNFNLHLFEHTMEFQKKQGSLLSEIGDCGACYFWEVISFGGITTLGVKNC